MVAATRLGRPVVVWFVGIDGLRAANDRFGHDFFDAVLREFLAVGLGIEPQGETLAQRIQAAILEKDLGTDRWCGTVSIATATGMPHTTTLGDLIEAADARMYHGRNRP